MISLLLVACSDPKTTIIEFESIDPVKLSGLLEHYSDEDIQYNIIDNRIIFHSDKQKITRLVDLLKQLDSQTNHFLLTFNWGKHKRYSTTTLPNPISLAANLETPLTLFEKPAVLNLKPISNQYYSLNITFINKTDSNQVKQISIPYGAEIKLDTQQTTIEEHYQIVLSEGKNTKTGNTPLPKGLHVLLEKL